MRNFDRIVEKINFKRAAAVYLIAAVILGILSAGALGFLFREKLAFACRYGQISREVRHSAGSPADLQAALTDLANRSQDVTDILILDSRNKITFSAKNSGLAGGGRLTLADSGAKGSRYLLDRENPNVFFKLVENGRLSVWKALLGDGHGEGRDDADDFFYESNFDAEKIYSLSYLTIPKSGEKIYFIYDVQPVKNGEFYLKAAAALVVLFLMLYWVLVALWVYANAMKSRLNKTAWGILTLFTNLAGLCVYLIYRTGRRTCFRCGAAQSKGNRYCTDCGARLGQECEHCHAMVEDGDSYCKNCGQKINKDEEK